MSNDTDRVHQALRRRIIEGTEAPGARLVEQRLAMDFACSRTPVREAVRRLESEGLVVVAPNRGAHVRPLAEHDVSDLYELRARLEAYAAELAAVRGTAEEQVVLREAATAFDAVAADTNGPGTAPLARVRRLDEANGRVHSTILAMSRHTRVQTLVASAIDAPLVFQALQRFSPDELQRSCLFHHAIADAICSRQPDRAGRLMTEHILQGRDALFARLSALGGIDELFEVGA